MNLTSGTQFTINSRKYDGSISRTWPADLVAIGGNAIELVGTFRDRVEHRDLGSIEAGTVSRERFYTDRWYNYFSFEFPAGTLRNYYFNICMPPSFGDNTIDYVDLDIDLIVWPDGRVETLDLEEFESNSEKYRYPKSVREKALATLDEVLAALRGSDAFLK